MSQNYKIVERLKEAAEPPTSGDGVIKDHVLVPISTLVRMNHAADHDMKDDLRQDLTILLTTGRRAGGVTSPDYVMDKDTDAKLFAAALYVISDMWGNEMGDLQRASLANQIVREIERRRIIAAPPSPRSDDGAVAYRIDLGHGFNYYDAAPGKYEKLQAQGRPIQPLYTAPPSPRSGVTTLGLEPDPNSASGYRLSAAPPSPSPQVGEMVELLTSMARAERGATAADFMPQHVKNAAEREALHCEKIASLLIALDAERGWMREALEHARQFIVNGVELGFIHIPNNDPAEHTLGKINAALKES